MASTLSTEGYEVVTPILSKAAPVPDASSINEVSIPADLKMTNKEHAEDAMTEATKGSSIEGKTIEINGTQYVEASDGTHQMQCVTINGINYVPENAPQMCKTAHSVLQNPDCVECQDLSQGEFNHASSQFRGQPIMVYVGSQSYSVHISILTYSNVLACMPLDEAQDGSYSISLPEEDLTQFERLLTYMYRGTWEPERIAGCGACCWDGAEGCICWDNKKYMQLYAIACKYGVYGLTALIAPKLDLKEGVLAFCEAFKCAYEKCPGSSSIRNLFRRSLLPVFENDLPKPLDGPRGDLWGNNSNNSNNSSLAIQLAELASCGGEFAVDLMQAFAMARENAILATVTDSQQNPGGGDECYNNDGEESFDWGCRPPAENEGCRETDQGLGWGAAVQFGKDSNWRSSTPLPVSETPITREDVENIHVKLRGLEDMVSSLQLTLGKSAQTQQAGFPKALRGDAQGFIPPGWVQSIPLQPPPFQPGSAHRVRVVDPRYQAWREEQAERDQLIVEPLYRPSLHPENYVDPASCSW